MSDDKAPDRKRPDEGITSPEQPTHEATKPPGNPDVDEDARRKGEDTLERAGH